MACECEQCGKHMHGMNGTMVILKDSLWLGIASKKDILCDTCIESRLGRKIKEEDFKPASLSYIKQYGHKHILVNSAYAFKHNLKLK